MHARDWIALSSFVLLATAATAAPPDLPVPVANPGFEAAGTDGLPQGWSLVGPPCAETAVRRAAPGRSGEAALELSAAAPASLVVASGPVALKVGHVYRLSAWIRTESALSDPLARYPTAVPAALAMESFPFTNHSPAVGGTREWTLVETTFVATAASDRVLVHLGLNGTATGRAWFDDVSLAELGDVTEFVPLERVRWEGPAFRYDDRGWIFVHVEGAPYARGRQFGALVADEIAAYVDKLSIQRDANDPEAGWNALRTLADALMLRRFEPEFLEEMKGTADGAAKAGAKIRGRKVDLLDVVTLNSVIDLEQMEDALPVTPHAVTGRTFLAAEEEMEVPERTHKCSSLSATAPATKDGRIVFFQLFMWGGYTGVHFNVVLDVVPESGRRFVMQTFPGGIHSGTDFYINDAGIVIGETTTLQTPFRQDGTPQSNRVRRAIQYASSIDELVSVMTEKNNGMYTNDWTLADVEENESAILLLGTERWKLWRSTDRPAPFGTPGFLWANNNARDPAVRREVAARPEDAPFDSTFTPWNRDVAFQRFFREHGGAIDVDNTVQLMASSPVNRPHACDGKVTDSAMAEKLVFMGHQGKVTLREKFPAPGSRRMPDLPGAVPHLTYGYETFSPVVVGEQLKAARAGQELRPAPPAREIDLSAVRARYEFGADDLWRGTIFPASDRDNWLISGSAAYWQILHGLPEEVDERPAALGAQLAGLQSRLNYLLAREADLPARAGGVAYDRFAPYLVPRIKGTFALHQLRLAVGNEAFFALMKRFFEEHRGREVTTEQFFAAARSHLGREVEPELSAWLERTGLPAPVPTFDLSSKGAGAAKPWQVRLTATQPEAPYRLAGTVAIDAGAHRYLFPVTLDGARSSASFSVPARPVRVEFAALTDFPVVTDRFHTFGSFAEEFDRTIIVYGTARQIEANHTLALRFQSVLADAFSESLPPVVKDAELSEERLASSDLFVLGDPRDNTLLARLAPHLPVETGPGWFRFDGRLYAGADDGLYLALPSPFAAGRVLHLLLANSPLQLFELTKSYRSGLPAWAVFRKGTIESEGHFPVARFVVEGE